MTTYVYQNGMAVAVEEPEPSRPVRVFIESVELARGPIRDFGLSLTLRARVMPWDEVAVAAEMCQAGETAVLLFSKDTKGVR